MHPPPPFETPPPDGNPPVSPAREIAYSRLRQFCFPAATYGGLDEPPSPGTRVSRRPADPDRTAWN
jgi:hypothetical protein